MSRWRTLLALLPIVVLLGIVGTGVDRWRELRRDQDAVYARAAAALAAGDFDTAAMGFSTLGDYRDADERLGEAQASEEPVREALDLARLTFDSGDYANGFAQLEAVVQQAPGYAPASELLSASRDIWIAELTREIPVYRARRDWLGAELALRQLSLLRPDDAALAAQLTELVRDHAPVVFVRGGAVFLDGPQGNQEVQLTAAVGASFPSWSPDRSQIAFIASSDAADRLDGTLMLMNGDGSDLHVIAQDVLPNTWPVWSPDGRQIAFSSVRGFDSASFTGTIALHVYSLQSERETDLTGDQLPHAAVPSWSPDGSQIVFASSAIERGWDGGIRLRAGDIYLIGAAGGPVRDLTQDRVPNAFWVQWSPDGDRLLLMSAPGDWAAPAKSHIYLLGLTSDELTELPVDEWQVSLPLWSPDGSEIAFVTGSDTINVWSGDDLRTVPLDSEVASFASWSPDGRALLAPPVDSAHPGYIVAVAENFGSVTPVTLDFDSMSSATGLPIWSGVTPFRAPTVPIPLARVQSSE